ncbi:MULTISPECIES: hypothetical protein [Halomonas]|nr:hypothetical protein [Halomonas colorata]
MAHPVVRALVRLAAVVSCQEVSHPIGPGELGVWDGSYNKPRR